MRRSGFHIVNVKTGPPPKEGGGGYSPSTFLLSQKKIKNDAIKNENE